eukprot:TRINITY_DN6358_c0_g1_i2.p3 TRINITY_DN6358_c0_g1~~TRINITY_DN6358_c0_g1_i2.p3  ORF type:complete len:174 (-),score=6.80 TRINITY_DN6358_c0_g1_i2:201-722(-)
MQKQNLQVRGGSVKGALRQYSEINFQNLSKKFFIMLHFQAKNLSFFLVLLVNPVVQVVHRKFLFFVKQQERTRGNTRQQFSTVFLLPWFLVWGYLFGIIIILHKQQTSLILISQLQSGMHCVGCFLCKYFWVLFICFVIVEKVDNKTKEFGFLSTLAFFNSVVLGVLVLHENW